MLDGTTEIQSSTTLYDIYGNPVTVTDPKDLQSTSTYDFLRQLKTATTPDAGESKYIYDKAGRLRFMMDAEGAAANPDNILYWNYDTFGRITDKGYINTTNWYENTLKGYADNNTDYPSPSGTWRKRFTYDAGGAAEYMNGRLTKVETNNDDDNDTEVEESFVYNKYGDVVTNNLKVIDFNTLTHSTSYAYDNIGRVTTITYPSRPNDLNVLNENITGSSLYQYEANNTLTAGPSFTINPGAKVTFKAGTKISLKPGITRLSA